MPNWKVIKVVLPPEINTHDKLTRFMESRFTLNTEFKGTPIRLRPGVIKPLGKEFLGNALDDGLGDIYLVKVNPIFMGIQSHDRRHGTKDSWSMLKCPLKYMKNGSWCRGLSSNMKNFIQKVTDHLYMNGEYHCDVTTSGGSFGSGNQYHGKTSDPGIHVQVVPAKNKVTIPEYTKYGIPTHSFGATYDKQPYFSFGENAPVINDMDEATLKCLIESYTYLCQYDNHNNREAYDLGQFFKLLHQGGFKYMVHKNYGGGVHIVEELQYCVMQIGSPPYDTPHQLPIKTGAGEHIPKCLLGRENFEKVSIDAICDWGVHFGMYSALKPGRMYVLSRQEPTGIKHYWTAPALVAGGFIYRPKSGTECDSFGCVVFPFGTTFEEQKRQGVSRSDDIKSRCVACFDDNCATIGFTCRGHKHHFLCDKSECASLKSNFATGSLRTREFNGVMKKYVCPICRMEHLDFS